MADVGSEGNLSRREAVKKIFLGLGGLAAAKVVLDKIPSSSENFDPEIQPIIEKEGVRGVHLRMYFWDHYFNKATADEMQKQGVTVISGEIKSGLSSSTSNFSGKPAIEDFFDNLKKLPNGVTGFGQMRGASDRSAELLKNFSVGRAILASDNGIGGTNSDTQNASNESLAGWSLFATLTYLAALGSGMKIANKFGGEFSRRQFLKMAGAGLAGAGLSAFLGSAFFETAQNQGWIDLPKNVEVSYLFSKLFNSLGVDPTIGVMELAGDKRIARAFESLVRVRNQVMALNNWYLIESVQRNKGLKQALTGKNKNVEVGFYAAWGHVAAKAEFCKGPDRLMNEIGMEVNSWLDQYESDLSTASNPDAVNDYYLGLMQSFGKPTLYFNGMSDVPNLGAEDYEVKVQTPMAIMYKSLIERAKKDGDGSHGYKRLLSALVRDQHFPDGTYINVTGKNVLSNGKYSIVLEAKDSSALSNRFLETGYISRDDLKAVDGELYPDLYVYPYIGNKNLNVSVGLAIVRGMAITYSQQEDTSFIKTS